MSLRPAVSKDGTHGPPCQAGSTYERLAAAVEQVAEAIVIVDAEGTIEYVNPAFERITGFSYIEALGRTPEMLQFDPDPALYHEVSSVAELAGAWSGRESGQRKDGTAFQAKVTVSPVRGASGATESYVLLLRDVTEQVALEANLRQARKLEAVGRLAGGVAHDLGNILTAIQGYTELILRELDTGDPIRADAKAVMEAADRAAALIRQLFAFSRKQPALRKVLDLNRLISDLQGMLRRLIGEDIELVTDLNPSAGCVKADPAQVEQVIVNLAANARDAMPRGGKLVLQTAHVVLDEEDAERYVLAEPGPYVMLAVLDTGCGMSEEVREHLFEPFYTTKEEGKGTGLGLSTVYDIIKQAGGFVSVYSEVGEGTMFKVHLPRVEEQASPIQREAAALAAFGGDETNQSSTILVVGDDATVRELIERSLTELGYRVLSAARPEEALRLGAEEGAAIDLLITDVVLPGMDGRHLAEQVRGFCPQVRVLYVSGYTDEFLAIRGILDHALRCLEKPFTPAALARQVREALDRSGETECPVEGRHKDDGGSG